MRTSLREPTIVGSLLPLLILLVGGLGLLPSPADAAPQFILKWGTTGTGGGQFDEPSGIAVGPNGDVYVVDRNNDRVQMFSSTGVLMTQWGSTGTGNGQFDNPRGVTVDPAGRVYVTDSFNARVQKFTATGGYLTQWGSLGNGDGQFSLPRAVKADGSGFVYVTDDGFSLKRVQKFTDTGVFVTKWGSQGSGDGQFAGPRGIAVDDSGYVYVADAVNDRIQKFTSNGAFVLKFGISGSAAGNLSLPAGLAWSGSSLWVADLGNDRIQEFTRTGAFVQAVGSLCRLSDSSGCVDPDGGGPLDTGDGQFNHPQGIAWAPGGDLFVGDSDNDRVQRLGTPQVTSVGGEPSAGGTLRVAPNPTRGAARVSVELPEGSEGTLEARVLDLAGRSVRLLGSGPATPGSHAVVWDGLTEDGRAAPGGIYFVRITAGSAPVRIAKLVRVP
jgi:DNA-binding beta-propeller fold protein YncE